MVCTRSSAGADVSVCSGGQWRSRHSRLCYRFTRAGKPVRNRGVRCAHGCEVRQCANFAVCGEVSVAPSPEPYCHLCTFMLACKPVRVDRSAAECPICLERCASAALFPGCERHKACLPCMRKLLFGNAPNSRSPAFFNSVTRAIHNDSLLLCGGQRCPICRRGDSRSMLDKALAMASHDGGETTQFSLTAQAVVVGALRAAANRNLNLPEN